MATKHDEFKVYYFSFTDDELEAIYESLHESGYANLADEIWREAYGGNQEDSDDMSVDDWIDHLDRLEKSANSLADAYERLHDAMSWPVEYRGAIDAVDRLINELMSGAK